MKGDMDKIKEENDKSIKEDPEKFEKASKVAELIGKQFEQLTGVVCSMYEDDEELAIRFFSGPIVSTILCATLDNDHDMQIDKAIAFANALHEDMVDSIKRMDKVITK